LRGRWCPPIPPRTLDGEDEEVGVPDVEQVGARARDGADRSVVQVLDKVRVADGVVTLTLAAPDGGRLPDWTPGAHVDLTLEGGLTRQYSLCGDRWDAHTYRVGVLLEPAGRGGSRHVHEQLEPGHLVGLGGPRNHFPLVPAESYLFVAGGIGITPVLPMIAQAELLGADWRLLYGGRTRASMAFLDELAGHGDRVQVAPQDEGGLRSRLAGFLGEPRPGTPVYACGPAPLLTAMAAACAGWPARTLRTERFVAAEQGAPVRAGAFDVELHRSGRTVTVAPDTSVLEALSAIGVEVLSSCRQGTCGTCETTVLAGRPDHRDSLLDDDERAAGDCMYPCVSRSRSDLLVLDL
jgi:ferredoxin-NADP reductase